MDASMSLSAWMARALMRWLLSCLLTTIAAGAPGTSCDDVLTSAFPNLCNLSVEHFSVQIRGLTAACWKYTRADNVNSADHLPVVVVHGGPAWSHQYMITLKQQACRGREVVFYDQVGAGVSSKPVDPERSAPWLFTIDYYVEELSTIVDQLGWTSFHFIGNSWGTIVGQAYGLSQDPRLRSLVLSGPLSDAQLYIHSQWDERVGSLGSLPIFVQSRLKQLEAEKAYDSEMYEALDNDLTGFFTSRTLPLADCIQNAIGNLDNEVSNAIYVGMQGHSEFTLGGVLKNMNLTGKLANISVPVLLTHGRYDTMRPAVIDALHQNLPLAWRAEMPHSGHCSMIDDPLLMNDAIGEFLDRVEGAGDLDTFALWLRVAVDVAAGGEGAGSSAGPIGTREVGLVAGGLDKIGRKFNTATTFSLNQGILLLLIGLLTGAFAGSASRLLWTAWQSFLLGIKSNRDLLTSLL